MANINQKQGPRSGNTGTPSKVANFHNKHTRADALAGVVRDHYAGSRANFDGVMEGTKGKGPFSLPKTAGGR